MLMLTAILSEGIASFGFTRALNTHAIFPTIIPFQNIYYYFLIDTRFFIHTRVSFLEA